MNYSDDLEIKLQKVNLAIAKTNDYEFYTHNPKKLKLEISSKIKKIFSKGIKFYLKY